MSGCGSVARSSKDFIDTWNKSKPVTAAVVAVVTATAAVAIDR